MSSTWRYWLEHDGRRYELPQGTSLLGRGEGCQVLLDDALVSRQHARVVVVEEAARIEDAGSSNGVYVNGARMESADLTDGDTIGIGSQRLVVRREHLHSRRRAHTMADTVHGLDLPREPSQSSMQREPLELLAPVIDKALALGRSDEAERLLGSHLRRHLGAAAEERRGTRHTERAVTYAVRLADVAREARWVDYCFELYSLLEAPLPAAAVEQLYSTLRNVRGVSHGKYKAYVQILDEAAVRFGPRERFLAQRIQGLGKLLR